MAKESKGSNLKFPKPSQSVHVSQKKDNMAHNIGGSEHMGRKDQFGPSQKMMVSGGKSAPKKIKG